MAPEHGRLLAFEDDERPALGVAGRRRMGGRGQGSLERVAVDRAVEETAAHVPPDDGSVKFQRRAKLVPERGGRNGMPTKLVGF